jgi:AraC-like DNA-binding protein
MHKLVFLMAGQVDLEGDQGGWLLLPDHMVFIPADRAFAIRSSRGTRLIVAHLDPADAEWHHHGCWITAVPNLAREMLAHALRWRLPDVRQAAGSRIFFRTLSHLCQEWFSTPRILWMPAARSAEVKAAVGYVRDHLDEASLEGAAEAAGCSARTLQRRCQEEFGFSWRSFSREVRIMRAMELLAHREMRIGAVSREAGFRSVAAFTVSFSDRLGISPSEFARRMSAHHAMKGK